MVLSETEKALGTFSAELQLMLACADSEATTRNDGKIKELLNQSIDWDVLLRMALHHRVYPLVYKTLNSLDTPVLPEAVAMALKEKCRDNAMQALRITGAAAALVNNLEKAAIRAAVLKGPPLAQRLYGDIALRPFKDIDLFVWPEDLAGAEQVLETLGYRRTHPEFPLSPSQRRVYIKRFHHFTYRHSGLKTEVELHWQIGHTGMELPLPQPDSIKMAGCGLPVLPDEEWFLFLVLHGTAHSWFRLRWLCDIAEFTRIELDWERVRHLSEQFAVQPLLHQSLLLTNKLLGAAVPPALQMAADRDAQAWKLAKLAVPFFRNAHDEPWDESRLRNWRLYWRQKNYDFHVRTNWNKKLNYFLNMFNPAEEDMRQVILPERLFFVYYVLRPFMWLHRRTKILQRGS